MKSARIRNYSGPYFPAFGLNTFYTEWVILNLFEQENTVIKNYTFYAIHHKIRSSDKILLSLSENVAILFYIRSNLFTQVYVDTL